MILAVLIFAVSYVFIATEKYPKSLIAMLGASLIIIMHIITQSAAFGYIDFNVVTLLISMMVLVKIIERTGVFEFIAISMAKRARGNPHLILAGIFVLTAVFSAMLDNVTTVLLITPVTILICNELDISPMPFFIAEIFASNLGGTATLIGDPPNIMIGSAAHLTFSDFVLNLGSIVVLQLVVFLVIFYLLFKRKMVVNNINRARIMEFDPRDVIKNRPLMYQCLVVFAFVLIGLFIHGFVDLEASTIAMTGAVVLMLISRIPPEEILTQVEWPTIFFFVGLFVLVGGLENTGVINMMSGWLLSSTGGDLATTGKVILWGSGLLSAVIDNIPFVATMIPLIQDMGLHLGQQNIIPLWWALSLGACLGGNATLIGASANVIVAGLANRAGHKLSFFKYLLYGLPLTILSLLISYVYLIIKFL